MNNRSLARSIQTYYSDVAITQDLLFEQGKGKEIVLPHNSGMKIQGLVMPFLKNFLKNKIKSIYSTVAQANFFFLLPAIPHNIMLILICNADYISRD